MSNKAALFTLITALVAVYVYRRSGSGHIEEEVRRRHVLAALLAAEQSVGGPDPLTPPKVAVGFGACLDIFVDALELLQTVKATPVQQPKHADDLVDIKSFVETFTYFFQHGAAAERYIQTKDFFDDLVTAANELPQKKIALGGNAPVMAQRFKKEGLDVLLASTISSKLRESIDPEIDVVGQELTKDDIHLILEYSKNKKWGEFEAPRANRFIVHNDANNPFLRSMEEFTQKFWQFSPDLLVVSGMQMMDNFPFKAGERQNRLQTLEKFLLSVPKKTLTHFELASFAEESCFRDVVESVVSHMDSLGMNEQELPNLYSILTNGSVTLISDPFPRIATTLDQMRAVFKILGQSSKTGRPVTRMHVHTLAYQAIMTTRGSPWKNTMSAAAKASLTANRHICGSNRIYAEKARILMDESFSTSRHHGARMPFDAERPVTCWTEDSLEICIAPNLVCTQVVQTAGGGDNISSAGLVLQV